MKKIVLLFIIFFTLFVFDYEILGDTLYNVYDKYQDNKVKIISNKELLNKNKYYKEVLSNYVHETDNYTVKNKQELINVYFTAINNGYDKLTFYCDEDYLSCFKDIDSLDSDDDNFSYINQLVNVYNSYSSIGSTYSSNLKVDIEIDRKYSEEDIKKIDEEINSVIDKLDINNYENINDKIKVFHDYLASINKYDKERAESNKSKYKSDSAIGALFEGMAVCSGYTDAMALFLDKLSITNTRVSTSNHVWNAALINGEWKHIDLTWDDPVTSDGSDIISYDYYLISTNDLINKKDGEHYIINEVYDFLK